MLKQKSHLLANRRELVKGEPGGVLSEYLDGSRVWLLEPDDEAQQHTLPGSAAAQYSARFAGVDGETNAIQHMLRAKRFVDGIDVHDGRSIAIRGLLDVSDWTRRRGRTSSVG